MISQTAEYALRAVVCLAQNSDHCLTAQQLAALTLVPSGYLSKVLQSLARGGIVNSQRGLRGGFVLAVPAEELTILRVLDEVDPVRRIHTCPLNLKSHGTVLCPLHRKLDDALAEIQKVFGGTTIAQILRAPSKSTALCDVSVSVDKTGKKTK